VTTATGVSGWVGVYGGTVGTVTAFTALAPSVGGTFSGKNIAYFNENMTGAAGTGKDFAWYSEGGTNHLETGKADTVGLELERFTAQSAAVMRVLDSDGTTVLSTLVAANGLDMVMGGTITATDVLWSSTKAANLVLAGPTTGAAATPAFRSLVAADVPTLNQNTSGNAATATALQNARTINGTSFNGTANITVTADASTLTGTTLNATVVSSSLTSVGTIATGVWSGTAIAVAKGGTGATSASITAFNNITGYSAAGATGTTSTNLVFSTSPTFITPTLGAASATSLNGNTFTTGTYTLTGQAGKTLTFNGSITLTGTDAQTYTFPTTSATIARTDAANTFTGVQTMTSPALTTPAIATGAVITEAVGTSALVLTGNTQVTSFPVLSATQTWNAAGVAFTAWKLNVTNTASATASLLLDLQIGGSSLVSFDKFGQAVFSGSVGSNKGSSNGFNFTGNANGQFGSAYQLGWSSSTPGSADLLLLRGGAATLQHGADVNGAAVSQTLQAANGITGTDKTGGNFTFASGKGTGAGAVSSLIFQTPTALVSGATAQSLTTRLTIDVNGIKATGYLSSDGSAGVTAGPFTTITGITVKNGLVTALTGS